MDIGWVIKMEDAFLVLTALWLVAAVVKLR